MKNSELRQLIREEVRKVVKGVNEYVPYHFDDQRGKELRLKYDKAFENPAWKHVDGNYVKTIKLNTLLKITGLSLKELQELDSYGDESWKLNIDEKTNTVTEFND